MSYLKSPEKAIMLSTILLMATGLIFIYSVSGPYSRFRELPASHYFLYQFFWAVLALIVLFICSRLNYQKFLKLSPLFMLISLACLVWVLLAPSQQNVHRWLSIGFIRFQPSEVFKISLFMYLAYALVDIKNKPKELKKLWLHLVIFAIGILLVIKQPDLGTTMLIFFSVVIMLFLVGLKLRYLLVAGLAVMIIGGTMVFGFGYEKDRIDDYVSSLKDPLNTPDGSPPSRGFYQNRQSLISVGSGGVFGRGLGGGGQKNFFLPAPHTDFIFSASAEEGGFILCVMVLGLLLIFSMGTFKIANSSNDLRGYLLAAGLGIMITLQAVINIGVALGLLPITGITLPFFSYGGSSLVISCAAVGLILSVARHGKKPLLRHVRVQ